MEDFLPIVNKDDSAFKESEVKAKYNLTDDGRWLAVIFKENFLGDKLVLTIGVEKSRKAIKNWIKNYMKNKCWENNNEDEVTPDMYDRANKIWH